jgi:WD40 repeat protein
VCEFSKGIRRASARCVMKMVLWWVSSRICREILAHIQVTGSSDKTLRQWDVSTGQCVLVMDILWAIANPPAPPPTKPRAPRLAHRSSTSFGQMTYEDILPSSDSVSTLSNMSGAALLSAATGQNFSIPTPPFADGSWDMYQDFVGGLQFWGYALASGSGDGGVRMWDSELLGLSAEVSGSPQCERAKRTEL